MMASSQHERTSAEQMDELTRPYFIHHRNQVSVNTALMDLFRLIDTFLQTDESARAHLFALRSLSDFVQQKQLVAPMPANPLEIYDSEVASPQRQSSSQVLGDLLRILQLSNVPTSQMGHQPRHLSGSQSTHHELPPAFVNPPFTSSSQLVFAPPADAQTIKSELHRPTSYYLPPRQDLEETKDVSCIQLARDKLRSWLARPDTAALKKFATGKRRRTVSTTRESRPDFTYSPMAQTIGPSSPAGSTFPRSRTLSMTNADTLPRARIPGKILVTTETSRRGDSLLPPRRERAVSFSQGVSLPTPTTQENEGGFTADVLNAVEPTARLLVPPPDALIGTTRLRKPRPNSTSITFATPSDNLPERSRSPPSAMPKVISPRSSASAKRTTMSSDGSMSDARILQASKKPIPLVHAANTRMGKEDRTKSEDTAAQQRHSMLAKERQGLPPLPGTDDSDDGSESTDTPPHRTDSGNNQVPKIMVQPPSSAGTPQRNRAPMASSLLFSSTNRTGQLTPVTPGQILSASPGSSSKRAVPIGSTSRPSQPMNSDGRATASRQPEASPTYGDMQRSASARSYPGGSRFHEDLSRNPSTKERSDDPPITHAVGMSRNASTGSPYSPAHSRIRKPAPQINSGSNVTSAMAVWNEGSDVVPTIYERRPLSVIKTPVNHNTNFPYPSPKSTYTHNFTPKVGTVPMSDTEAVHRSRLGPEYAETVKYGVLPRSHNTVPKVPESYRSSQRKYVDVAVKSHFSADTETSATDSERPRSINSAYRSPLRMGKAGTYATSRQGELLAELAAKRRSSIRSGDSGSSKRDSRAEGEPVKQDEAKANQPRMRGPLAFPDVSHSEHVRSHSDNRGQHYAWRSQARSGEPDTTEWYIGDSTVERNKRPSL